MSVSNKALVIAGLCSMLALSPSVHSGQATPRIDQRQINQERRIEQGINSGRLTQGEANRLEAQQNRIENAEARVKADGFVTRDERRRLNRRQNTASRNIVHKKHNWRHQ